MVRIVHGTTAAVVVASRAIPLRGCQLTHRRPDFLLAWDRALHERVHEYLLHAQTIFGVGLQHCAD